MSADLALTHPELVARFELWLRRVRMAGGDGGVTSATRSRETQTEWYRLWQAGQFPNLVADPDRDAGPSPWGWHARGSLHMPQEDGHSHAIDIWWVGISTVQAHAFGRISGLRFPEPTEAWHAQWWDASGGPYPVTPLDPPPPPPPYVPPAPKGPITMFMLIIEGTTTDAGVLLVDATTVRWVRSGDEFRALSKGDVRLHATTIEEARALVEARTKLGSAPTSGVFAGWW